MVISYLKENSQVKGNLCVSKNIYKPKAERSLRHIV